MKKLKPGTRVTWYDTGIWRKGTVTGPSCLDYLALVLPDDHYTINGEPEEETVRWDELREAE